MFWGSKKLHKIKLKNFFLILGKKIMTFKHELSPSKPHLRSTLSLILGGPTLIPCPTSITDSKVLLLCHRECNLGSFEQISIISKCF